MMDNIVAWMDVGQYEVKLTYMYDLGVDYRDLNCGDYEISRDRINGKSHKLNARQYHNQIDVWLTPNGEIDEYFLNCVKNMRSYFKDELVPYVLTATAFYKGVELGSASIGGCWYDRFLKVSDFEGYDLISEAIQNAEYKLKQLRAV